MTLLSSFRSLVAYPCSLWAPGVENMIYYMMAEDLLFSGHSQIFSTC
jgi:hypothetical protein